MSAESAIEKLQKVTQEKEAHGSEHKWRHEEEAKEELKRTKSARMLNIQLLAMRSLLHSSSSSECEEGKQYHEKIQFAHSIIQDIYRLGTFAVEFLEDPKEVGVQMNKKDQELHQWIRCTLKNQMKTKVWSSDMWKDVEDEDVFEVGMQPQTKVQPSVMEIDMIALGATKARR